MDGRKDTRWGAARRRRTRGLASVFVSLFTVSAVVSCLAPVASGATVGAGHPFGVVGSEAASAVGAKAVAAAAVVDGSKVGTTLHCETGPAAPDKSTGLPAAPGKENAVQTAALNRMFPGVVFYNGPRTRKRVALTFDDGPDVLYTPQVLRILKQYHVKATFFLLGFRAKAHPDMVRRIVRDGHAIGNHTWNHLDLVRLKPDEVRQQIVRADRVLYPLVGYHPDLFRPPYGAANPTTVRIASGLGYKVVDWSVDTRDWAGTSVPAMLAAVRKEVRPGGIILEHCAGNAEVDLSNTVEALPKIIEYLRSQGYEFVTVPQLIGTKR